MVDLCSVCAELCVLRHDGEVNVGNCNSLVGLFMDVG